MQQRVESAEYWVKKAKEIRAIRDKEAAEFVARYGPTIELSEEEQKQILSKNIPQLREMVIKEEITISKLVTVFLLRALTVGLKLDALADINTEETLKRAKELEEVLAKTKKEDRESSLGVLFGVPISLKDCLRIKNFISSVGVTSLALKKQEDNSLLIEMMLKHGAVPLVKSNVPMALKTIESVCPLYGRTKNPYCLERTSGGSSGGESALISSYCSPAGIGGDIAGSLRSPAHYTNIWSIKPTSNRISNGGNNNVSETGILRRYNNPTVKASNGFMGRSVDDIISLFKASIDPSLEARDTLLNYHPWDEARFRPSKKLRLGYTTSCRDFPNCPAVIRAMKEAVQIGQKAGFEMVCLDQVDYSQSYFNTVAGLTASGFIDNVKRVLRGEKPIKEYDFFFIRQKLPSFLVYLIGWLLNKDPKRFFKSIKASTCRNFKDYRRAITNIKKERDDYEALFLKHSLDGLLLPVQALPALYHSDATFLTASPTPCMTFNNTDYPCGSIPVTFIREDEQTYSCPINDKITKLCQKNLKNSAGLPIGLQVGCRPYREETVLHIMKKFEEVRGPTQGVWDIQGL